MWSDHCFRPLPPRMSGYRMFDETTVETHEAHQATAGHGLSLREIDSMLRASGEHTSRAHESQKLRAALARTEERIAALTAVKPKLQHAVVRCTSGACTIMEQASGLSRRSTAVRTRGDGRRPRT